MIHNVKVINVVNPLSSLRTHQGRKQTSSERPGTFARVEELKSGSIHNFNAILSSSESRFDPRASFRTHRWNSANNLSNTYTKTCWRVRTKIHKHIFIQYLQMKVLMGMATLIEIRACYDAPGVLEDDLFISALRALKTDVPNKTLWQRLQALQRLDGRLEWSPNLYHTWNKEFGYVVEEIRSSIRKVKKFTGYVRNSSAVGTKSSHKIERLEPDKFEWSFEIGRNNFLFLTVGEFYSGAPGDVIFTLMKDQKSETVKPI